MGRTSQHRPALIDWSAPKSVLKALCSEPLAGLVSLVKLCRSEYFLELVDHTTKAALGNNFHPAIALLGLFAGTAQGQGLKAWYEARAALSVQEADGKLIVRPRKGAIPRVVALAEYFPEAVAAQRKRDADEHMAHVERQSGLVVVEDSLDLMDTKRRLPGSFGSGKRR